MIIKSKKHTNKVAKPINKTRELIIEKFFGKAPVFGNGLVYQQKLRSK